MRTYFLIVLAAAMVTSCSLFDESDSSDSLMTDPQNGEIAAANIFGSWRMVGSSGGFSGIGYGRDIDFLFIKKDSTFSLMRGMSIVAKGKFGIVYEDGYPVAEFNCLERMSDEYVLCNDRRKYIEFTGMDKLSLNGLCCDYYSLHFERQD